MRAMPRWEGCGLSHQRWIAREIQGSGVNLQVDLAADGIQKSGCSRYSKAGVRFGACAGALLLALAVFPTGARGKAQDSLSRMPEDPAKQLISGKCGTACHDTPQALDHPRTRDEWTDIVVLMRDYGAKVSPGEQKTIVAYLTKNLGRVPAPVKPASPPATTTARANSSSKPGSALVSAASSATFFRGHEARGRGGLASEDSSGGHGSGGRDIAGDCISGRRRRLCCRQAAAGSGQGIGTDQMHRVSQPGSRGHKPSHACRVARASYHDAGVWRGRVRSGGKDGGRLSLQELSGFGCRQACPGNGSSAR